MGCNNNSGNINETIILEPVGDDMIVISACTGMFTNTVYSCSGDSEIHLLSGETVFTETINPQTDNTISLGSTFRRFRELNAISGYSTVWTAISKVYTPNLDLGDDSLGNPRVITADNSVIQNDILLGGTY